MSLINAQGNDMRIVEEGELLVTPEMIKEQLADVDEDLVTVVPYGARMLVRHLNVNDDKVMIRRKSGIELDLKYTDAQINSKLNVAKIIKVGRWYNFYTNTWVDYSEMFNPGDIIMFEMVKYTPIIPNKYALVPFDSIQCKLTSYEEMAKLISVVQK